MSNIVQHKPSELATIAPRQITALDLMQAATAANMTPETISKFLDMHERIEANNARKAYHAARAAFKRDCPPIVRRTPNAQFTRAGTNQPRMYASRTDIAQAIDATLAANGLHYDWTRMVVENGKMSITCVVSHQDGYSTESTVTGLVVDSKAGCSDLQKSGTAQEYGMRYSLIQALGLTSCDEDTDGEDDPATINESQRADIEITLAETKADVAAFLKWAGVEKVKDIRAARYPAIMAALNRKRTVKA